MIGFIDTLFTQLGTTGNYTAIANLHTLQFTVTYALGSSVFTSRILVTDLSQSHCHFKSHMKSSFHRLIPFLPLFCNCQFRRLDLIQLLCSQAHVLADWRLETRLAYDFWNELFFITTLHGPRGKHSLSIVGNACLQRRCITTEVNCCLRIRCRGFVFTESFPSNERLFWLRYSGFRASCHNIFNSIFRIISTDSFFQFITNALV
jgi:hypothetical protein